MTVVGSLFNVLKYQIELIYGFKLSLFSAEEKSSLVCPKSPKIRNEVFRLALNPSGLNLDDL